MLRSAGELRSRALVVGADGLLGAALVRSLDGALTTTRRRSSVPSAALSLDLSGDVTTWGLPEGVTAAFLCAAVPGLEACRRDPTATRAVNVAGTVALAQRLTAAGVFVVYPSTNLVFDGESPRRRACDPVSPRTEYGRQKADAEAGLLALGDGAAVVRCTKILAPGAPLLEGWVRDLRRGEPIEPFDDMVLAPVPLSLAVQALCAVGRRRTGGLYQVSAEYDVSYADVGRYLARRVGAPGDLVRPRSAATAGLSPESVPRHTTLEPTGLRDLGLTAPAPWDAVDEALSVETPPPRPLTATGVP